jgi:hypothetical protein
MLQAENAGLNEERQNVLLEANKAVEKCHEQLDKFDEKQNRAAPKLVTKVKEMMLGNYAANFGSRKIHNEANSAIANVTDNYNQAMAKARVNGASAEEIQEIKDSFEVEKNSIIDKRDVRLMENKKKFGNRAASKVANIAGGVAMMTHTGRTMLDVEEKVEEKRVNINNTKRSKLVSNLENAERDVRREIESSPGVNLRTSREIFNNGVKYQETEKKNVLKELTENVKDITEQEKQKEVNRRKAETRENNRQQRARNEQRQQQAANDSTAHEQQDSRAHRGEQQETHAGQEQSGEHRASASQESRNGQERTERPTTNGEQQDRHVNVRRSTGGEDL